MPDKVTYEYATIRVVPKVEREEFLNVGVILFCKKKKFLEIKYQLDEQRLHKLFPNIDLTMLNKYLKSWELICHGGPESGPIGQLEMHVRFRWLTANRSTIIQSSPVHPGICEEPQKVLIDLFTQYVL